MKPTRALTILAHTARWRTDGDCTKFCKPHEVAEVTNVASAQNCSFREALVKLTKD